MSSEPVIVIFRERNDVCVCGMLLKDYPTGKVPEVGDKFPLFAAVTMRGDSNGESATFDIKAHDGIVTVVDVWAGDGNLLHPTNGCSFYEFPDDLTGYGIRLAWDEEEMPADVRPVKADVIFTL